MYHSNSGHGYTTDDLTLNVNTYNTNWGNRFISRGVPIVVNDSISVDGTAQFSGINVVHRGLELEGKYRATNDLTVTGMVSLGDWRYTDNFEAEVFDDNNEPVVGQQFTLYTEGAKSWCCTSYS